MSKTKTARGVEPDVLLDAIETGIVLACSPRTVARLSNAGRMPPPIKLGSLTRWSRRELDAWIARGCPADGVSAKHGEVLR